MRDRIQGWRKRWAASCFRFLRFACFVGPVFAVLGMSVAVQGQQLPAGDQLQQLQQQLQQRQGGGNLQGLPAVMPDVVQQPARRDSQRPLPPSRLEQIMSARAGATLRQFGYDQLGSGRPITVSQSGAVQDDYILGPGDEVVVSLRGQENSEFRTTVDRNGQVLMPRLNPISATGRSFGSFREDVESAVRRAYVATSAFVSIGRVRQIAVLVSGEVNVPGQRLISGLSSTADALLLSGGVKKTGSLRNVRIQRNGHEYVVDLYSILTDGGSGSSMRLADGDRILVPPLGHTLAVSGLVRRPGIYEMAPGQSSMPVRTLMSLSGGVEVRGRYRYSLMQIMPDGQSGLTALPADGGTVRDSEILFVQLGADQIANQGILSGGTGLAGNYAITSGTKLSEWLKAPGALGTSPYTLFGVIVRRDRQTLLRNIMAFTPAAVLAGREDMSLQEGDTVKIFTVAESRLIDFVARSYVQRLAGSQNASPSDYVFSVPSQSQRRAINGLLDEYTPGTVLAARQEDLRRKERMANRGPDALRNGANNPNAAGGTDTVNSNFGQQQQQQQLWQQQNNEQRQSLQSGDANSPQNDAFRNDLSGTVFDDQYQGERNDNPPGQRDTSSEDRTPIRGQSWRDEQSQSRTPAMNFLETTAGSDSFAPNREAQTFGQLAHQLNVDPLVLINFILDHRARIEGSVQGPGSYLVGPNALLGELVQAAGGTMNSADESNVELISTVQDRQTGRGVSRRENLPLQTMISYVVKPRDQFRFAQVFTDASGGSVNIQGEVRHPGTFSILRGEHLSDLLARAGGLTGVAYPYGAVLLRRSAAEIERQGYIRAAAEIENQLVVAMTRVGNDKIEPTTFSAMQTFVNDLKNQKAIGRVSVVADPSILASRRDSDPLLENGDLLFIPQRPSTVSVLGQVMQPGSFPYRSGLTIGDYIDQAGGYAQTSDKSNTFLVLPDGSARKIERSWLNFDTQSLPPGSTIVVPRDVTPLDLRQMVIDISQIFSQLAVSVASVAVISR